MAAVTGRDKTKRKSPSAFTRVKRISDRGFYDKKTLAAILDAATHCHIAHVIDGRPVALPTMHWRVGNRVYWHGNAAGRMLNANRTGAEVCLTATLIDGFVLARSGFKHSVNYRSVMCFGVPREVTDERAKNTAMRAFLNHWLPGRWDSLRPATRKEFAATRVFWIPLDEASAKIRTGGPHDAESDLGAPVWAGVLPLRTVARAAIVSPDYRGKRKAPRLRGVPPEPTVPHPGRR